MLTDEQIIKLYRQGVTIKELTAIVRNEENANRSNDKITEKQARYIVEKAIANNWKQIHPSQ